MNGVTAAVASTNFRPLQMKLPRYDFSTATMCHIVKTILVTTASLVTLAVNCDSFFFISKLCMTRKFSEDNHVLAKMDAHYWSGITDDAASSSAL
jgi:hypothetical protein